MYKIAALVYKAKFEWRKVLGDINAGRPVKVHLVDDAINIWTALCNIPSPGWKVWQKKTWSEWWAELKDWWKDSFTHIELWISDENGRFISWYLRNPDVPVAERYRDKPFYLGRCYTSTMRDGMAGTVLRPASEVIKHPEKWEVGVIGKVTDLQYDSGMIHINNKVEGNKGYDKLCIADFFNPLRRWFPLHSKWKDICSEAFQGGVYAFIRFVISKYICSPRRIVRILKKDGVVFTPVTEM